jgi:hypothetical protein
MSKLKDPTTSDYEKHMVKLWDKFKADNPNSGYIPHPFDMEQIYGPGIYHLNPNDTLKLFQEYSVAGSNDHIDHDYWKSMADSTWATAYDAGQASDAHHIIPNWYQFPKGRKTQFGPQMADPAIFDALKQEAADLGLPMDTPSRMQRAMDAGFRRSLPGRVGDNEPPRQLFHVRGGDRNDVYEFGTKGNRGPMGVYASDAPYDIVKRAIQTPSEYRRSIPIMFQGQIFGSDPVPDWFLPQSFPESGLSPFDAYAHSQMGSFDKQVYDRNRLLESVKNNMPPDLRKQLEDESLMPVFDEFWKTTAYPRYSKDPAGNWTYQGPSTKTAEGYDELGRKTAEETHTSPINPPDYGYWENYEYNVNPSTGQGEKRFPTQDLLQRMGYTGTMISDEAGYSVGIHKGAIRSPQAAFIPKHFMGGEDPSTNIMAGLGLTAVSIPALIAGMGGDEDDEDFWSEQLKSRMNGNYY